MPPRPGVQSSDEQAPTITASPLTKSRLPTASARLSASPGGGGTGQRQLDTQRRRAADHHNEDDAEADSGLGRASAGARVSVEVQKAGVGSHSPISMEMFNMQQPSFKRLLGLHRGESVRDHHPERHELRDGLGEARRRIGSRLRQSLSSESTLNPTEEEDSDQEGRGSPDAVGFSAVSDIVRVGVRSVDRHPSRRKHPHARHREMENDSDIDESDLRRTRSEPRAASGGVFWMASAARSPQQHVLSQVNSAEVELRREREQRLEEKAEWEGNLVQETSKKVQAEERLEVEIARAGRLEEEVREVKSQVSTLQEQLGKATQEVLDMQSRLAVEQEKVFSLRHVLSEMREEMQQASWELLQLIGAMERGRQVMARYTLPFFLAMQICSLNPAFDTAQLGGVGGADSCGEWRQKRVEFQRRSA